MEKAEAAVERREMFRERILREEEIAQLNAKMERAQLVETIFFVFPIYQKKNKLNCALIEYILA